MLLTVVIAGANGIYTYYARKQFAVMSGQLDQMQSSGKQTDELISLYQAQLRELQKQAADTHTLALNAGIQAVAAQNASVTTREALTSVQRAFIYFVGSSSITKTISMGKVSELIVGVPWQNGGVSPTKNAVSGVNWISLPGEIPLNYTFPDQGNIDSKQFEIPPKAFAFGTVKIPISFIESARKGQSHLFLHGWITYHDIFDKTPTRLSEFCDEVVEIKSSTPQLTEPTAEISWQLSLCQNHNCSDERCLDYKQRTQSRQ